jgi:hypothetical protein
MSILYTGAELVEVPLLPSPCILTGAMHGEEYIHILLNRFYQEGYATS